MFGAKKFSTGWSIIIVVITLFLLPFFVLLIFLFMWLSAQYEMDQAMSVRSKTNSILAQALKDLPVSPGATIMISTTFSSDFVLNETIYTAKAIQFYKSDPKVRASDVLTFYDAVLKKSGWNVKNGQYNINGISLQIESHCYSDILKKAMTDPEKDCTSLKEGYQKTQLLVFCDSRQAKQCHL